MSSWTYKPRPPIQDELDAREIYEHGICIWGNHAFCLGQDRISAAEVARGLPPRTPRDCRPVIEAHVGPCIEYLSKGEWKDGTGSYVLKHRVEDMREAENPVGPRYTSNGALMLAAARMGLAVDMSYPFLEPRSPNARIWKVGKVPAAKRGAKPKAEKKTHINR
jgi:hypothetical protein